jgi:hypothetical protein
MTRRPLNLVPLVTLAILPLGCARFSERDGQAVERVGGLWVPTGEAWAARTAPIDSVTFDAGKHVLTDEDFAAVHPSLRRMDPLHLGLRGSRVSDRSVPLINRLPSLREVDLRDTGVTQEGSSRLRSDITVTMDHASP